MEVIRVVINTDKSVYYSGFSGSFVTLADSCLRKKVLPGLYMEGLLIRAEVNDHELTLSLKTGLTENEVIEIMDVALKNTGTFPAWDDNAGYNVFVEK